MNLHINQTRMMKFISSWGQQILVGATATIILTTTILVVMSALDAIHRMNDIMAQLPNIIHQEMQQTRKTYEQEESSTRKVTIEQREETTKTLVQSVKETVESNRPIVINTVQDGLHPMPVIVVKAQKTPEILTTTPAPKIIEVTSHATPKLPIQPIKIPPPPKKKKRILFWHVGK